MKNRNIHTVINNRMKYTVYTNQGRLLAHGYYPVNPFGRFSLNVSRYVKKAKDYLKGSESEMPNFTYFYPMVNYERFKK